MALVTLLMTGAVALSTLIKYTRTKSAAERFCTILNDQNTSTTPQDITVFTNLAHVAESNNSLTWKLLINHPMKSAVNHAFQIAIDPLVIEQLAIILQHLSAKRKTLTWFASEAQSADILRCFDHISGIKDTGAVVELARLLALKGNVDAASVKPFVSAKVSLAILQALQQQSKLRHQQSTERFCYSITNLFSAVHRIICSDPKDEKPAQELFATETFRDAMLDAVCGGSQNDKNSRRVDLLNESSIIAVTKVIAAITRNAATTHCKIYTTQPVYELLLSLLAQSKTCWYSAVATEKVCCAIGNICFSSKRKIFATPELRDALVAILNKYTTERLTVHWVCYAIGKICFNDVAAAQLYSTRQVRDAILTACERYVVTDLKGDKIDDTIRNICECIFQIVNGKMNKDGQQLWGTVRVRDLFVKHFFTQQLQQHSSVVSRNHQSALLCVEKWSQTVASICSDNPENQKLFMSSPEFQQHILSFLKVEQNATTTTTATTTPENIITTNFTCINNLCTLNPETQKLFSSQEKHRNEFINSIRKAHDPDHPPAAVATTAICTALSTIINRDKQVGALFATEAVRDFLLSALESIAYYQQQE